MTHDAELQPAMRLVLLAGRQDRTAARDAEFRALAGGVADWAWVVGQAEPHGLAGMLCDRLLAVAPDLIEPELVAAAQVYLRRARHDAGAAARELADVVDVLDRAGVRALPFKGPVLAIQAYPDPALRSCRDLDVLIHADDLAATVAALGSLGYARAATDLTPRRERDFHRGTGQDILYAPDRLAVEPHWTLWPRVFAIDFEAAEVWKRAGQVHSGARPLPCPSPEDALLMACIHGCKETWARAIWIADIAGLIAANPALDWDAILRRATGVRRMVLLGADLAARLFGASLPTNVARQVAVDRAVGGMTRDIATTLFSPAAGTKYVFDRTRFRFRVRERWPDRLRYASRILLQAQEGEFRSVDLPDALRFLYPAVRLLRLAHEHMAMPVWHIVTSRRA